MNRTRSVLLLVIAVLALAGLALGDIYMQNPAGKSSTKIVH